MSGRKKGFTLAQHRKAGPRLWKIRDYLTELSVEIGSAYPLRTKAASKALLALQAVDELRSKLDDLICEEHPGMEKVTDVYYCASSMQAKKGGHQ